MQFNAKNGVFGPGGHGGGIFQTTVSGLGSPDGLGALAFNTKNGNFGPGGHGGGIFQTTVSGVGTVEPSCESKAKTAGAVLLAGYALAKYNKAEDTALWAAGGLFVFMLASAASKKAMNK